MTLIPELRFPEFEGEWIKNRLGTLAKFSKGKGISKSDIVEDGELECIRYGELYTEYSEVISEVKSRTNVDATGLVLSESNDVIIPASGETQIDIATASCVLKAGIALGGDLNIIKSSIEGVFLSYYLNNARKYDIARLAQGISVVHLYASQLRLLSINLPSPEEQQKIAAFLTAVDQRIRLLQQKKAKLEEYKKGLMQKLFSWELRFKDDDGKDFPDWEERRLGDIFKIVGGGTPDTSNNEYWRGDIAWFTPTEIKSKYVYQSKRTISEKGLLKSSSRKLPIGTLLFTSRATIGDCSISRIACTTNQGFQSFLPNENHEIEFLYYWVIFNKKEFVRKSSGSTFLEINKTEIRKIKINLPVQLEQRKIAEFLSFIDDIIEKISQKIEKSKAFKKGLLQKTFV